MGRRIHPYPCGETEQVDGIAAGGWPESFAELLARLLGIAADEWPERFAELLARVCERSDARRALEGSQTAGSSGDKEIAEMR
ncbi:hypothetical protein SLEP1_g58290 [Rubroshorea leprosula]|uniref:Uncharacterized protein n=1 Tax=Rubroshorea leprosula TaxID=152421 RepID=A0AAV5MTE1_9ROSI|nr:hypothetical protein SLEP1_g58290 [Rubroshorea leprosula]